MSCFTKYLFLLTGVLFFSCGNSDTEKGAHSSSIAEALGSLYTSVLSPKKLSPEEYITWVKEQHGLTYAEASNDQFAISLVFHPTQLEAYSAAVANGADPKKELASYLDIQKGFYYCTAECVIKSESASSPIKKTDLLNAIRKQLTVVENNKDTLKNVITESFPSYVMNQPNKLLILIPSDSLSNYQITINGSPFRLKDCQLNLSSTSIQSFPLIKL